MVKEATSRLARILSIRGLFVSEISNVVCFLLVVGVVRQHGFDVCGQELTAKLASEHSLSQSTDIVEELSIDQFYLIISFIVLLELMILLGGRDS